MAPEHLEQVAQLERQCFSSPWSLNALSEELCNPRSVVYSALLGDVVIGYCGMHHIMDEGYITNVAVSPIHRQIGVGRALVAELMAYARSKDMKFLTLEVRPSNTPAIGLYASFGFKQAGVRKSYYVAPVEDALILTAYLE